MSTAQCGTNAGYQRHHNAGEDACQPCKTAHTAYTKSRPGRGTYQRARQRALGRLARRRTGEYAALLAEEIAKEAKVA